MTMADDDERSADAVLASADVLLDDVSAAATVENQLLTSEIPVSTAHDALGAAHADELWDGKREPDEGILSLLGSDHSSDFEWRADGDGRGVLMAETSVSHTDVRGSNIQKASRGPKTPRRAKKRYRPEVLLLRESVAELERELSAIKSRQETAESVWSRENEEGSDLQKWQKAARTEIQATARARLENIKFKDSVNRHAKHSRDLQKLLLQRSLSEVELLDQHSLSRQQQPEIAISRATAKETKLYEQLVKSINARVCDLEAASKVTELADINSARAIQQQATISDFKVLMNEEQALCIDLVDRYIVPFDFQAVARVLWEYVLSRILKLSNRLTHTEVIKSTSDLIVTKQSSNSNLMIKDHQLTTEYSVAKRILCADRVDFLWESITVSSGSVAQGTPAIQLAQKGWGKIAHVNTVNGSGATSLLSYTRLTPSTTVDAAFFPADVDLEEIQERREHFDVRRLATHIVSGYRLHVASVRRFIENLLLDEMLQAAKSAQQC